MTGTWHPRQMAGPTCPSVLLPAATKFARDARPSAATDPKFGKWPLSLKELRSRWTVH
jgi:hypothetical protein